MHIKSMALECHLMQQADFTPIAVEWLFFEMNGIKVARHTPGIMKHLKANLVWKPFTREALKACLRLLSSFEVLPSST
jgi:hypothetical protein